MAEHVLAIDQGTTSTRAIVFDATGSVVSVAQREHEQIMPRAGWVEHDPIEIWTNIEWVTSAALVARGPRRRRISPGIGVTNQRETAIVWDRRTGQPGAQRARVAGHPHPAAHRRAHRRGRRGSVRRHDRTAARDLLLGVEDRVDPRERPRRARRRPRPATCCSARPTPGSSGTSRAAGAAASTSPTSRTPAARCSWICARSTGPTSCSRCGGSRGR